MRLLSLIFAFIIGLSACTTTPNTDPEHIGETVFGMLKSVPQTTSTDWLGKFMSIEEIHAMAEDESLVKDRGRRLAMKNMTEYDWNQLILEDRTAILERGLMRDVVWEELEYDDFEFEVKEEEGIKGVDGKLLFSSNDKEFSVTVRAIWDGSAYRLSVVEELDELRER